MLATRPMVEPLPAAYRPPVGRPGVVLFLRLDALPARRRPPLGLACRRLGVDALPGPPAALILAKAQGHPFFTEELALALRDSGLIVVEGNACRVAPASTGTPSRSRTASRGSSPNGSTASPRRSSSRSRSPASSAVIFALRIVRDIYPIAPEKPDIPAVLDDLERREMTRLEMTDPDIAYIFKHTITQEVAYGLILYAQRRRLHGDVAAWYEDARADGPARPMSRSWPITGACRRRARRRSTILSRPASRPCAAALSGGDPVPLAGGRAAR